MDIPFVDLLHFIEQIRVIKHFWFLEDFVAVASAKNNRPAEGRHMMGDLYIRNIAATATLGRAQDV